MRSLELHPISDHPSLATEGEATESEADAEHTLPGRKTVVQSEEGGLLRAASSLCMRLVSFRRTFSLFYEANPYVIQGYRKPSRRLSIALKSAFRIHNETVNIWSHIIPTIVWAVALTRSTWHLGDAPWLVTWSLISGIICFSMSAFYHLFRFMSPNAFKSWLKMDHLGVCLLILSCELTWTQLLFSCLPVAKTVYTTCIICGGVIVIISTLLPQRPRAVLASILGVREYEVAEPIMAVIAFSGFVGLFHYLYYYGASLAAQHIFVEATLYISGFVIFSLKLPERIVPMVFDIWGNSHQLWHIIIVVSSIWHVYGLQWFGHLYHMNCLTDEFTNPSLS